MELYRSGSTMANPSHRLVDLSVEFRQFGALGKKVH
jgi:hypothetical protein